MNISKKYVIIVYEKKIEINTKQYKIKIKINAIRKDEYFENQIPPILNILDKKM